MSLPRKIFRRKDGSGWYCKIDCDSFFSATIKGWNSNDSDTDSDDDFPDTFEGFRGLADRYARKHNLPHGENPVCDDATFDRWLNISYRRLIALNKYLDKIITKKSNVDTAAAASTADVNNASVHAAFTADDVDVIGVAAFNVDVIDGAASISDVADGAADSANGGNQIVGSIGAAVGCINQSGAVSLDRSNNNGVGVLNQRGCGVDQGMELHGEGGSNLPLSTVVSGEGVRGQIQVRDIPAFNASELRQRLDFRDISLDNPELVPMRVRDRLSGVIEWALEGAQPGSVLNVVLRGPSLACDVQAVLNSDDQYNTDLFLEEIAQVLQSNDTSLTDDELKFVVTVVCNRSGGACLKFGNVPYDEILSKKGRFLYNSNNCENSHLCFCLCLAHFKNAKMSESEKLEYAKQLHSDLGFDLTHRVSFSDVIKFEQHINAKIIVFHHAFNHKRVQCFQTHYTPNSQTVWLYLYDDHYYLIENQTGFLGASYVCQYCYETYESLLYHTCKHRCSVCFTEVCRTYTAKTIKCNACKHICKSACCYDQHKRGEKHRGLISCDPLKFCVNPLCVHTVGSRN